MHKYLFVVPHGIQLESVEDWLVPHTYGKKFKNGVWFVPTDFVPEVDYSAIVLPPMSEMTRVLKTIKADSAHNKFSNELSVWSRGMYAFCEVNKGFALASDAVLHSDALRWLGYDQKAEILPSLSYKDPESNQIYANYVLRWYEVILPTEANSVYKIA